jgi:very-short-patch-repair endonuclease
MWEILRNEKIAGFKFRRQYSIYSYIVDFFCTKLRLAIEIDGEIHDTQDAKKHDLERQQLIENLGIKFIRFKNEEVFKNIENVKENLYQMIEIQKNVKQKETKECN